MEPHRDDDAIVDLLDVLLREGAIVRADVIVTVADVPLIGIKLSAAVAGMETMTEYGLFEEWDARRRMEAVERRQYRVHDDGGHDEEVIEAASAEDDRDRNRPDGDRTRASAESTDQE